MIKFLLCTVLLAKAISATDQEAQIEVVAPQVMHFTLNAVRHRDLTKNMIFPSVSLEAAFGMLLKGAGGKTALEIKKLLHFSNTTDSEVHSQLHQLILKEESKPMNEVAFKTANLALLSNEFQPRNDYVNFVKENYHGLVVSEDFANSGQKALDRANAFVQKQTHGQVKGYFKQTFDRNSKLAVVSTSFFNGLWLKPFPPANTRKSTFYNANKTVSQVDMMHMRSTFKVCPVPEAGGGIVYIPLKGGLHVIMLLSDDRYGWLDGINWLTERNLADCTKRAQSGLYDMYLPKFKLEHEFDVKKVAERMGAKLMFDPTSANFKGLSDTSGVYVSSFVSRASFEYSEGGTEDVAQLTAVNLPDQPIKALRFDHPFGIGLMDKERILYGVFVGYL